MSDFITDKLKGFVEYIKGSINCQLPAQVLKVNEDNSVDVLVFRNDEISSQLLPAVKVKHLESGRAFIHLGVAVGDYGIIKCFDTNVRDYLDGQISYNNDNRSHDVNDACFELGFIPNPSSYIYPTGSNIAFGNKDGSALVTVDDTGIVNIIAETINVAGASKININGNTVIDGKTFLEHQHSNGNNGANTGAVI